MSHSTYWVSISQSGWMVQSCLIRSQSWAETWSEETMRRPKDLSPGCAVSDPLVEIATKNTGRSVHADLAICLLSLTVPAHHYDVIKWKHFPRNWPFVRGIHRSPVNSPHKGQWRGALMFSLHKRLSRQSWGWWFKTLSCPLWRHCNDSWLASFHRVQSLTMTALPKWQLNKMAIDFKYTPIWKIP